jgi:hypothetical protein
MKKISYAFIQARFEAAQETASFYIYQKEPSMATKLKAIPPTQAEPAKPKVLIFGKPGVGKTWTSLDFPNVYYIDTEGGANLKHYTDKLKSSGGVYMGPDQGALSFDTLLEQIEALATEKHQYKTLVIDSITKIYNMEIAAEAERLGDKDAFGASKKPALQYMRRLISWLTRIDMNVILIAHEKDQYGLDEKRQRNIIGTTFDCYDKLEYELHLCLNVVKLGGTRKARVTKSRLEAFKDGEVFEWSYDGFADRFGRDVLEGEVKQITLANAEQLAEVQDLISRVKLPEGQVEKWLKAADVEKWEEMDGDKVQKVIDLLKKKLTI